MYQKCQISRTIVTSFQVPKSREKQISQSFSYCELINLLRNGTIVHCLWENKKTSEKSVFREAWSPKLTSQSFPVPCFWSRGFVPHRKWNLMLLVMYFRSISQHQDWTAIAYQYGEHWHVYIKTDHIRHKSSAVLETIFCTTRLCIFPYMYFSLFLNRFLYNFSCIHY